MFQTGYEKFQNVLNDTFFSCAGIKVIIINTKALKKKHDFFFKLLIQGYFRFISIIFVTEYIETKQALLYYIIVTDTRDVSFLTNGDRL